MQTGQTLYRYFNQKTGAAYTNFLDTTKANRLFKNAIISLIERVYKANYDQKAWDEISFVTKTQYALAVRNNAIVSAPISITNIVNVALTVTVTTALPHGLAIGDTVTLQDVQGITSTPAINGSTFTLTAVTATTFSFVVTAFAGVYVSNTGSTTSPLFLNDYWHLLTIRCQYKNPIYNIAVSGATKTSPIKITLNSRNNIRTGDQLIILGVTGNTNANGTFYVKSLNDFSFALYSDIYLQTPVAGNGNYVSGGTISRVTQFYAQPYTSTAKIGTLNIPTSVDPYFEIADNLIKLYPQEVTCTNAVIDYIRQPNIVIDVTNDVIDLTTYYPEKFLFSIVDEAAVIFGQLSRDMELINNESIEQQKNP